MPNMADLQRDYDRKKGELQEFIKSHTGANGLDFTPAEVIEFTQRNDELGPLFDALTVARKADAVMQPERKSIDRGASGFGGGSSGDLERGAQSLKTLGDLFFESEEYKSNSEKTLSSTGEWKVTLNGASVANTEAAMKAITIASGNVLPYAQTPTSIVPFATRRPVVRSLIPMSDPEGQYNLQFIRENLYLNNAAIVPEGQLKPLSDSGTERVLFTLEAVAHAFKVSNQALRFIPGIRDRLNQKGTLGILQREEDFVLNYDGSAGWKGFYVQTGVQSTALGAQDPFTAFHAGMTLIQFTPGYANVTGGLIHPNDWHRTVTIKDANGRFIYGDPAAAEQSARIWGVPLVPTPAALEGTPLIGDFENYSRLWVDPAMTVAVGYENDDLRRNQQTIVIEEFMALEIDRPAAFVKLPGWDAIGV